MNETNIHKNKNKSRSKFLVPAIAVVVVLALVASTLMVMNDAVAALSDPRDRLGVKMPGIFISNGFLLLGSGLSTDYTGIE